MAPSTITVIRMVSAVFPHASVSRPKLKSGNGEDLDAIIVSLNDEFPEVLVIAGQRREDPYQMFLPSSRGGVVTVGDDGTRRVWTGGALGYNTGVHDVIAVAGAFGKLDAVAKTREWLERKAEQAPPAPGM